MSDLTVADVLDRAADLIEPEGKWSQGSWARDRQGNVETLWSDSAVSFCMRGAITRVAKTSMSSLLTEYQRHLGFTSAAKMARWNDRENRTQAEVVAKLRQAAALAREQAA